MENYTETDLQAIGSLMIKNSLRVIESPEGEGWIMYNFEKDKIVGKVYPSVNETKIGLIRDEIPTWGSKGISSMEHFLKLSGRMDDYVNNLNSTLLNQINAMVENKKNITREQVISLMIIHQGQIKN